MSTKYGLAGYNNSRKHISISIPSSTEVMSPHIKSVEELRVLGINLSSFGAPTQFFICVAGVFIFYLVYGYLQVRGKNKQNNLLVFFKLKVYARMVTTISSLPDLSHIFPQELIFSVDGFKPFGWYLTLVQFGFYSLFGLVELQLTQDKRRRCMQLSYYQII